MNHLMQFLVSYGGPILFLVGFAEQSGLPFPGGPCLLAAGALAASGKFNLIAAIAWAAAGSMAADAIWFFLGHWGKARVFRMFPHLPAAQVKLERATLTKMVLKGLRMLTAAKFLPGGSLIPMHAGALGVSRLRFLLVDAFTSVVYAAVFVALGFAFHEQLEQVAAFLQSLGAVSLLLMVVLAGTYVVRWFLKHDPRRKAQTGPETNKAGENICATNS